MSKQTIIDWQKDSLLVATCNVRGTHASLHKVSQQACAEDSAETAGMSEALSKAVYELGVSKTSVVVVASREVVEVRTLSVPRIDSEELPDVIRFQAQRQLANMGDNWALDYVMLPDAPGQEMQTALVGAISPAEIGAMESACAASNLQLTHIALRPIEIARYAVGSGKLPSSGAAMMVCLSEGHADLLILKAGQVVLVRGTKLPEEQDQVAGAVAGEVRRSLMAAAPQLGTEAVAQVLLFAAPDLAELAEHSLSAAVNAPVSAVDPASLLPTNLPSREHLSHSHAHRIAAIAGSATLSAADKKTTLDFKNPKKRPPKKKNTARYVLAAAAGVALLLAGASWWYSTNRGLDEDLAFYEDEVEGKEELVKAARKKINELAEIENFLEGAPNFLDELAYISQRIPPAEEVIIGGPTFSTLPDGRGQIRMPVAADSSSTLSKFESSLRDENHAVKGRDSRQSDHPTDLYKWEAVETITISGRGWQALEKPPASSPKTELPQDAKEQTGETTEVVESQETPPAPENEATVENSA